MDLDQQVHQALMVLLEQLVVQALLLVAEQQALALPVLMEHLVADQPERLVVPELQELPEQDQAVQVPQEQALVQQHLPEHQAQPQLTTQVHGNQQAEINQAMHGVQKTE